MKTTPNKNSKRRGFVIPVLVAGIATIIVGSIIAVISSPPPTCPKDGTALTHMESGAWVCAKCLYTVTQ
jgi:hypothetical protein